MTVRSAPIEVTPDELREVLDDLRLARVSLLTTKPSVEVKKAGTTTVYVYHVSDLTPLDVAKLVIDILKPPRPEGLLADMTHTGRTPTVHIAGRRHHGSQRA